jgi:hypothetical protein
VTFALETVGLEKRFDELAVTTIFRCDRHGGDWWRKWVRADINGEIAQNLARFHLPTMNEPTATLPYGSSGFSRSRSLFQRNRASCCWMSRPRAFPKASGAISSPS